MPEESSSDRGRKGSGNVYADLGIPGADEMLVKAQLAMKIGEIIKGRGWTQQQAASVLDMTQPKLSKLLRGQFRGISEVKMMEWPGAARARRSDRRGASPAGRHRRTRGSGIRRIGTMRIRDAAALQQGPYAPHS